MLGEQGEPEGEELLAGASEHGAKRRDARALGHLVVTNSVGEEGMDLHGVLEPVRSIEICR